MSLRSRYYLPEAGGGPLRYLGRRITGRPVPRFPRTVQIQTTTGCNADCVFCPYGSTHSTQPRGRMEEGLFRAIIDECARYPVRRISPYLMNEPFLDPGLPARLEYIRAHLPRCKLVLTTNGSLLRRDLVDRILVMKGVLDALYISFQGVDPVIYEETMRGGMRFQATLDRVNYLIRRIRELRVRRPEVWITMVQTELLDVKRALRYWSSRGVRCQYTTVDNRGGNLPEGDLHPAGRMEPNTSCTRLFKQAYILFNGDMVLCCADYRRSVVLGNVGKDSLYAVWNGGMATGIRRAFLSRRFRELVLCRDCRVDRFRERSAPVFRGFFAGVPVRPWSRLFPYLPKNTRTR